MLVNVEDLFIVLFLLIWMIIFVRKKEEREREREILLQNISSLKDFERKSYYYFLVTVFLALR